LGNIIFSILILRISISLILIFINSFIGKKVYTDREKPSPFECGFDPKRSARLPFSIRFYLIALIFLIFDVEITLILPIPSLNLFINTLYLTFIFIIFLLILIIGAIHE
jgi:NADH-ubiquinone oxidoreductase chain 3